MGPWECVGACVAWCGMTDVYAASMSECVCVREIDMGMDMHTCILYVHTHVTWSVKGARDAEACKELCMYVCSLCVHVCVFVCMIVG